jgi:uroporphyrinogen-III synthase
MQSKPLTGIGVAITRPVDQAKKLAALITDAGGTPILFPLIEITPLADYSQFEAIVSDINNYDWAIFISSNAVQNGMPRLLKQGMPHNLKFAAIGPVTANELEQFGVQAVLIPSSQAEQSNENKARFDSESLLAMPQMHAMQGKKVMIFRGVGGREVLAETLKTRGGQVIFAECYQRVNPQTDSKILEQLWLDKKLHGVVVTSSEAMRHLLDLAGDADWLHNVTLFVNHARIAELPLNLDLKVAITNAVGDEAMTNLISKNYASAL